MEENEKMDSDSSSVITMSSVVGLSSDLSDPEVHLKDLHIVDAHKDDTVIGVLLLKRKE